MSLLMSRLFKLALTGTRPLIGFVLDMRVGTTPGTGVMLTGWGRALAFTFTIAVTWRSLTGMVRVAGILFIFALGELLLMNIARCGLTASGLLLRRILRNRLRPARARAKGLTRSVLTVLPLRTGPC